MLRIPSSTYRLQLHKGFNFDDAAAIADYLHDLGISHVYSSPYLQAAPGSTHGYDVVDHQKVNEELGGTKAHKRFCKRLGEAKLGQVLDIVPNHMSLGRENCYWWDVLENGTSSRYASFFDIDWQPYEERLRNKVLVPVLADQYGRVLQAGEIRVVRHGTMFQVECAGQALPVAPQSLAAVLMKAAEYAKSDTLSFLAASFGRLPAPEYVDRQTILARHRDKLVLKGLLARLCLEEPGAGEALDRSVAELNEDKDALDDFLNQQNYRLAYWKTADQQLGYRRFFDVNTLIGLRVEREHVFEETHALVLDWLRRGVIDGLRVDHPDGLRDPLEYFRRLRERAPDAWIIGEKILEPGEFLRESWPIEGTTGYDFLNVALNVLVAPEGMEQLNEIYEDFTAEPNSFPAIAHDKKINVTQEALGSDVNRLTTLFVEICESNRDQRDYTRAEMRRAVREVAACFAVYRSYVGPTRGEITDEDRVYIGRAIECAKQKRQDIGAGLFDFLRDVLTLEVKGKQESELLLHFQQFTPPVMAKGVEDTAFYCYNRLVAMCEVGGDPGSNGLGVDGFHAYCAKMQATHPHTMMTLSTHDTKRSDDVRARLAVLSEMPEEFAAALNRWSRSNNELRAELFPGGKGDMPDRNTEYMLYQTLIGAWPITVERAQEYMLKATREAKQKTSWTTNNVEFEGALNKFIGEILHHAPFVAELEQFVAKVKDAGRVNSLAQTLLKHTAPGVPDLYQGGELWDLSLVDPDNRRPVDYALRAKLLREIKGLPVVDAAAEAMRRMDEGLPKLWTVHQALCLRRERPDSFGADTAYVPLEVQGAKAAHAIAYLRGADIATIVPRLTVLLGGEWGKTAMVLPRGRWRNRLTGRSVAGGKATMAELLKDFPVALLGEGIRAMHEFTVWAPRAKKISVKVGDGLHAMAGPDERGWWKAAVDGTGPGSDYGFVIDDDPAVYPDPRSAQQPNGVHGLSRIYDQQAFAWHDGRWQAPPLASAVFYELHVGTFTVEGTFGAAIARLDYLFELGVTHLELMPVAAYPGDRGWGYDGVQLFAVTENYGGPDALKRFVDACHVRGLAVVLDVVYNHFGPVGNYAGKFGPYLTARHCTPWGDAVNFEGAGSDEVRRFFCDNAMMWMRDFHIDGLRLDAVHEFVDRSAIHFMEQLSAEIEVLAATLGGRLVLIAESDLNDPRVVTPREAGGYGIDAQWSDDFHHALFTLLHMESGGYYADFGTMEKLAKSLTRVFVYDGAYSKYRRRRHGRPVEGLSAHHFLGYIQDHDQVGNRATGDRLEQIVGMDRAKVAAAVVLTAPFVPLLFQGEEFAASTPFLYFADHHDPEMARAVSAGRKKEFAAFGFAEKEIPDPEARETFERSRLNWHEAGQGPHAEMLEWYWRLIHLRRNSASLNDGDLGHTSVHYDGRKRWLAMDRGGVQVVLNLGEEAASFDVPKGFRVALVSRDGIGGAEGRALSLPPDTVAVLVSGPK